MEVPVNLIYLHSKQGLFNTARGDFGSGWFRLKHAIIHPGTPCLNVKGASEQLEDSMVFILHSTELLFYSSLNHFGENKNRKPSGRFPIALNGLNRCLIL